MGLSHDWFENGFFTSANVQSVLGNRREFWLWPWSVDFFVQENIAPIFLNSKELLNNLHKIIDSHHFYLHVIREIGGLMILPDKIEFGLKPRKKISPFPIRVRKVEDLWSLPLVPQLSGLTKSTPVQLAMKLWECVRTSCEFGMFFIWAF